MAELVALKALVIDDSRHIQTLVSEVLKAVGMDVRTCGDGESALLMMRTWKPDIVLVDFEMRPMTGADFTRALRRGEKAWGRRTPVLMMTAHGDQAHVLQARDAGVDGMVAKPLSTGAILARVQGVLDRTASQ
jgi:two-component system, chemotaxis family, chemotaxis protein CheY